MAEGNFFDFVEGAQKRKRQAAAQAAAAGAVPAAQAMTVSQLTALIEDALKARLPASVLVRGEVSNLRRHGASGHLYFTLKDPDNCIDCVMFRSAAQLLKFTPRDGMELLATGRVGVYGARGRYQLYATRLDPLGQGALELAFQQMCQKLKSQGLFDPAHKQPLPRYPQRIALVTSKETAALQDMLKVLRRFPPVQVLVYHVPVQGDGAAEQMAQAITLLNRQQKALGVDLIILARGGGSLEDLWQFNEEVLARAVFASRIPVLTGIGHETDVSAADLVADYHAHTPTEAAQVAVQHWRAARDVVDTAGVRLRRELRTLLQDCRQRLATIERHEVFRRPADLVDRLRQRLDDQQRRLAMAAEGILRRKGRRLGDLANRLEAQRPAAVMSRLRSRLSGAEQRLYTAVSQRLRAGHARLARMESRLSAGKPAHRLPLLRQRLGAMELRLTRDMVQGNAARRQRLESLAAHLNAVGPEQVLKRGYTLTMRRKDGQIVRSSQQLTPGDRLLTRFADGQVESVVEDAKQMRLFE